MTPEQREELRRLAIDLKYFTVRLAGETEDVAKTRRNNQIKAAGEAIPSLLTALSEKEKEVESLTSERDEALAKGRREGMEEAIQAVESERLEDALDNEADEAYNLAIDDAISAILSRIGEA